MQTSARPFWSRLPTQQVAKNSDMEPQKLIPDLNDVLVVVT